MSREAAFERFAQWNSADDLDFLNTLFLFTKPQNSVFKRQGAIFWLHHKLIERLHRTCLTLAPANARDAAWLQAVTLYEIAP